MANDKDFKVKNGIQPTSYFEGVGTVVSSAEGYYVSGATYSNVSTQVTATGGTESIFFKPDGLSVYIVVRDSGSSTSRVEQFNLTTAWDLTTISSSADESVDVGSNTGVNAGSAYFSSDGTKMFVTSFTKVVYEYSLSTAWSVSTASYSSVSFTLSAVTNLLTSITFNDSGTKLYAVDYVAVDASDKVYQYSLSTAWDASTLSYDSKSFTVGSQDSFPKVVRFNSDGTKMFMFGNGVGTVFQYSLSTAYDVSTASYDTISYNAYTNVSSAEPFHSMFFKDDGTKLFISDSNRKVYELNTALNTASLDLSTGSVFDYTPTSDVQVTLSNPAASGTSSGATLLISGGTSGGYDLGNASYNNVSFDVSSQEPDPFSITFNGDGTKMYIGMLGSVLYQYSLSIAYDISTATYDSVSFSFASQDSDAVFPTFNNSGTKLYVTGNATNNILQYSLSTAYDISTLSYDSVSLNVFSQDDAPRATSFNADGTKLYLLGSQNQNIYQYSLSTAFDLSTASYDSVSFSVTSQANNPRGLSFNNDGTKVYVSDGGSDTVYQYSLSTAFDISTASYDSISFVVSTQDTQASGISFNADGTKLYLVGLSTAKVYQYSTGTPATLTYDPNLQWSAGTAPTAPAIGETDVITFNTTDGGTTYTAVQAIDGAS